MNRIDRAISDAAAIQVLKEAKAVLVFCALGFAIAVLSLWIGGCATGIDVGQREIMLDTNGDPHGSRFTGVDVNISWGRAKTSDGNDVKSEEISPEASATVRMLGRIAGGVFGAPPEINQTFIGVVEETEED